MIEIIMIATSAYIYKENLQKKKMNTNQLENRFSKFSVRCISR